MLIIEDVIEIVKTYNDEMIGKRFGLLTVVSYAGSDERSQKYYEVECDCGETRKRTKYSLYDAYSCGCATGEVNPPLYETPKHLDDIPSKKMRGNKLLVFKTGFVFRIKGKLLFECQKFATSRNKKYHSVTYSDNNKQQHEYVHRLVAEAFIPNPNNHPEVNHIDNDGFNNDAENLEWVTSQENHKHAYSLGVKDWYKHANPCFFCNEKTNNPYSVCKLCYLKFERLIRRKEKIDYLRKKYGDVDLGKLTDRQQRIVKLTMNGKTQRQIGETYGITGARVGTILKDILKKHREEKS